MKDIFVYNYDPITKEFTTIEKAGRNPLNPNEPIVPACATLVKPLDTLDGYAIIWVGNKWEYKEDHRKETWFNAQTDTIEIIQFIGELPNYYYTLDSTRANKPDGTYWLYDQESDKWVGNALLYKQFILSTFNAYWEQKQNTPFEFEGFKYIPAWRELYTSIWVSLRDGIKDNYRIQDCDGKLNNVDINSMKNIIIKMSDVNDQMYIDKHNLEAYFKTENNFDKLQNKFNQWLNKKY